jgi:hypothetical protein
MTFWGLVVYATTMLPAMLVRRVCGINLAACCACCLAEHEADTIRLAHVPPEELDIDLDDSE